MSQWKADLSNAALLIWDMQYGIAGKAFNLLEIKSKIKQLSTAMAIRHKPVVYTQTTGSPYEYQSSYARYRTLRRGLDPKTAPYLAENSHEWALMDDMKPESPEDLLIKKYTPSLFVGTPVELFLRSRGVESIIITGVNTEFGVETTARHAACLGFIPIIAEDAVGSGDEKMHTLALEVMRSMYEVKTTEELLELLKK